MKVKTLHVKIINTWLGSSVLVIGVTIMLGSFLNLQNDKIFTVAVFAGALIFIGFLIKSFPSNKSQNREEEQDNKGTGSRSSH